MSTTSHDIDYRLREVELDTRTNAVQLTSHEKECAVRYGQINESIASLNGMVKWFGGSLILGMASILAKLIFG